MNEPGDSRDPIPCYATDETLKDAGFSYEQLKGMGFNFPAEVFVKEHGYSAEELKQMDSRGNWWRARRHGPRR